MKLSKEVTLIIRSGNLRICELPYVIQNTGRVTFDLFCHILTRPGQKLFKSWFNDFNETILYKLVSMS